MNGIEECIFRPVATCKRYRLVAKVTKFDGTSDATRSFHYFKSYKIIALQSNQSIEFIQRALELGLIQN